MVSLSIDDHEIYKFYAPIVSTKTSDVSACTWSWTVLKHRHLVLGLVLDLEGQVLGLGLGLGTQVLANNTASCWR